MVGVLTQPDRPKGRGRRLAASPVKQVALTHALSVAQPDTLRTAAGFEAVAGLSADVMVVVAYGQILPADVLRLPHLGCINIHASLLPRWRGAAPIQRAVLAGDTETGVTLMQMDEGLDTGGMLAVRRVPIGERDTSASLHDALAALGAVALLEVLEALAEGSAHAVPQPQVGVTYASKIAKSEARIDWSTAASAISRQVRAFIPGRWPKPPLPASRFASMTPTCPPPLPNVAAAPGEWLGLAGDALRVACGTGELYVTQLQRAGRKVVTAREFVNSAGNATGRFA